MIKIKGYDIVEILEIVFVIGMMIVLFGPLFVMLFQMIRLALFGHYMGV